MKHITTFKLVITALFAALICVSTMLIQIPIPATGGYANLGDGVILMCSFLVHPACAVIAAGLGSALADILAGYVAFAPGTLVIKAGLALIASLLFTRFGLNRPPRTSLLVMILAGVLSETFMVLGYFVYEAVFMGAGLGAAGAIWGNIGQAVTALIVSCASPILHQSSEIREFMDKTRT